jgi:hypothetical protein
MLTVTEGKDDPCFLNLLSNLNTLLYVYSQRLFAEDMEAPSGKLDGEFGVHPVLNTDDNRCRNPWLPFLDKGVGSGQQFSTRCKDILDGNTVRGGKSLTGLGTGFGQCDYFAVVRMVLNKVGKHLCEEVGDTGPTIDS